MSIKSIRTALETHLEKLSPGFATAFENVQFKPSAVPYQRVNLLRASTLDPSILASNCYRERGIFQVTVCYPVNKGPGAAEARAELIQKHFKRGTKYVVKNNIVYEWEDAPFWFGAPDIRLAVYRTPSIGNGFVDGDRFCIPVSITFEAEVFV